MCSELRHFSQMVHFLFTSMLSLRSLQINLADGVLYSGDPKKAVQPQSEAQRGRGWIYKLKVSNSATDWIPLIIVIKLIVKLNQID